MNPLAPFLRHQGFVMLDGGTSTELERLGADLDDPLWTSRVLLDDPDRVRAMHRAYLAAGADVIATATYQATLTGFQRAGLDADEARAMTQRAVALAVEERDRYWSGLDDRAGRLRPLVAVSLGPYGACLHDGSEYHGTYDIGRDALRRFHAERIDLLAGAGGDLFAFETIPSLDEALLLAELVAERPEIRGWLSFSVRDERHVAHGETFVECARRVAATPGMIAVGVNCTAPANVPGLLRAAAGLAVPLAAYPNSGEEWDAGAQCWRGEARGSMDVLEWYRLGARLIGGCCRTGARDITAMKRTLLEGLARGRSRVRGKPQAGVVE